MRKSILLAVLPLSACAGADNPRAELETVRLALDPQLLVGSVDDPIRSLTAFGELEVGPDGRIYTLHTRESMIRVHGGDGEPVATIGGPGEGPGEFQNPRRMGLVGDTLWVLDSGTYRFSLFGLDGALLGSRRVRVRPGERGRKVGPPRPDGLLRDGTIYGSPPAWSRLVATGELTEVPVLRMSGEGEVGDTIAVRSTRNTTWAILTDDFGFFSRQPFSDTELINLSPYALELVRVERTAATAADPDTFRVTKLTLRGDTVFTRGYAYLPQPVGAALVDSLVEEIGRRFEEMAPRFGSAPAPGRAMEMVRETLYRPDFHPPVSRLLLGRDGTVWLRREDLPGDSIDWTLLAPNGEPIGTVAVPKRVTVQAADRQHIWGMMRDELDVPYIVRYGVVPSDDRSRAPNPGEMGR